MTTNEVQQELKSLDPNKASDIYDIKPVIIKDLATFLTPTLTRLYNHAIDNNTYPHCLKNTKVIELFKKGDPTLPSNYRPISLLPILGKVFDSLINKQIMTYLTKHNLISPTPPPNMPSGPTQAPP